MTSSRHHKGGERAGTLALLRRRDFALVWWGGLISIAGSWMLRIALPVTVYDLTGSIAALAGTTAATYLPLLLLGPWSGVLVDRMDRRRLLVVANIAQAAALLPLVLVDSADDLWIVLATAALGTAVHTVASSAENALLPRLVDERDLVAANALNAANNNLARFVGPLVGGAAVLTIGLRGVALVDAVTFLAAALLVALVRGDHMPERDDSDDDRRPVGRVFGDMREGLTAVARDRVVAVLFVVLALSQIGEGVFGTLYVAFVTDGLGGTAAEFGWLNTAQAVGGVLGGLTAGWFASRWTPRTLTGAGYVLFGLVNLVTFLYPLWYPHVPPAIALMIVVGVPGAVAMAALTTLLQRAVPDALRGRVFALLSAVMGASVLLGTALAGVVGGSVNLFALLSVHAATGVLGGVIALIALPRTADDALPEPVPAPAA